MAIVTGELYKGFTFGDVSSKDYGVYITQEAAYNAPDRDVEVVEIAGRNGAYILDKGRFKNITVSYKCGIALDDEQSFESAIRTFRNALSSKAGKYVRLEDDYNVNEYRQAAFLGGIEVDMADRRAGEFTVSFDAMPQRFLKSGETAVSVASGGTITNPTLFESHPLLQVWGYGDIGINDDTITIADDVIGETILQNSARNTIKNVNTKSWQVHFDTGKLRTGDTIKVVGTTSGFGVNTSILTAEYTISSGDVTPIYTGISIDMVGVKFPDLEFTLGTAGTHTARWTCRTTLRGGGTREYTTTSRVSINTDGLLSFYVSVTPNTVQTEIARILESSYESIVGYSTKSALGEPLLFDLDIGEAYKEEGGSVISVNNAVSFPARLPVLKSGANTITYDNTVDQFRIVPRWWEV